MWLKSLALCVPGCQAIARQTISIDREREDCTYDNCDPP